MSWQLLWWWIIHCRKFKPKGKRIESAITELCSQKQIEMRNQDTKKKKIARNFGSFNSYVVFSRTMSVLTLPQKASCFCVLLLLCGVFSRSIGHHLEVAMFASRIKCPRTELPTKNNPENCTICSEKANEDIFECCWCESRQHSSCVKISPDHCNVLNKVVSNVVFFCSTCLERLP